MSIKKWCKVFYLKWKKKWKCEIIERDGSVCVHVQKKLKVGIGKG